MTNEIITLLEQNREVFQHLLSNKPEDHYQWKQGEGKWSLREIVCHLHDEEVEDFRERVKCTIETPGQLPPAIDPVGWVTKRKYAEQDYEQKVKDFLHERTKSVEYLKSLDNPDWNSGYDHPELGFQNAMKYFVNWLAHDFHHIRQINVLNYDYLKAKSGEDLSYAGRW